MHVGAWHTVTVCWSVCVFLLSYWEFWENCSEERQNFMHRPSVIRVIQRANARHGRTRANDRHAFSLPLPLCRHPALLLVPETLTCELCLLKSQVKLLGPGQRAKLSNTGRVTSEKGAGQMSVTDSRLWHWCVFVSLKKTVVSFVHLKKIKTRSCTSADVFLERSVRGIGEGRCANSSVWLFDRHCSSSVSDV